MGAILGASGEQPHERRRGGDHHDQPQGGGGLFFHYYPGGALARETGTSFPFEAR